MSFAVGEMATMVLGSLLALNACQSEPLSGPPRLNLGRDECGGCGMIISEDRCSSALLIADEGERRYVVFDDIGCMLEYEPKSPGAQIIARFVHDYNSRQWVAGQSAFYIRGTAGKLATPMGSGIIAFADKAAAESRRDEVGGVVTYYDGLREAEQAGRP
jgi:nitrous oxide reductase accessory protein NosL